MTPYFVMKVGHVPLIPYHRPGRAGGRRRCGAEAIERYGDAGTPIRAVMLARLGPNVWHDSPATAMAVLEELEETARLMLLGGRVHEPLTDGADRRAAQDVRCALVNAIDADRGQPQSTKLRSQSGLLSCLSCFSCGPRPFPRDSLL